MKMSAVMGNSEALIQSHLSPGPCQFCPRMPISVCACSSYSCFKKTEKIVCPIEYRYRPENSICCHGQRQCMIYHHQHAKKSLSDSIIRRCQFVNKINETWDEVMNGDCANGNDNKISSRSNGALDEA